MREFLAQRVREIQPSATLAINKKAKELKARGLDVVNLSVGEPDFDTPEPIKQVCIEALNQGFTKYTDSSGIIELRQAVCDKLQRENGISYAPDQVVVSNGAKHSLANLMYALLDPGDEVIIPAPYWVSYPEMVKLAGGKPVVCPWNDRFKIDVARLKELISPRTKALVLNYPSNPTGVTYNRKELEELADILVTNKILCISDEIYEKILFDGATHTSIGSLGEEIRKLTIVVNGVAKTFSMTGWRIGYIAAPKEIAAAVGNIQSQTASNPVSFAQKASVYALNQGADLAGEMVAEFARRRSYLIKNLHPKISYPKPDGAFYFFLNMGNFRSEDLARRLLEEYNLAVVPGRDFGADAYVRISFAVSMENLKKAVERLNEFMEKTS